MQEWLTAKIPFDDKDFKRDLFAKIEQAAPNRKLLQRDEDAKAKGHVFLRTPVAH